MNLSLCIVKFEVRSDQPNVSIIWPHMYTRKKQLSWQICFI